MIAKVFFLAMAITLVVGSEISRNEIKVNILRRLLNPNDTLEQQETKDLIADFLAETILGQEDDEVVPFRRDQDHHGRERTRRTHRTRKPAYDYRQSTTPIAPVINNQAAAASQALNPAAVVDDTQTKQGATQVPIITGTGAPAAGGATNAPAVPAATAAAVTAAPTQPTTRRTRATVDPNHVYGQVDKILGNVATGNIVGIVDESLAIRAPTPVRNFVTGILKVIFCNPIDRLLGRCTPNSTGAISSVQGG